MAQSERPLTGTLQETSATSCYELHVLLPQLPPSQYQDTFSAMDGNGDVKSGRDGNVEQA